MIAIFLTVLPADPAQQRRQYEKVLAGSRRAIGGHERRLHAAVTGLTDDVRPSRSHRCAANGAREGSRARIDQAEGKKARRVSLRAWML
jgi:hypothetical protein